ncbi:MAG: DUF4214 domain-containing protein [Aquihabitans sp.]
MQSIPPCTPAVRRAPRRRIGAALALAVAGSSLALAVGGSSLALAVSSAPSGATAPEVVTGRISGKADYSNASAGTGRIVTAGDGRFVAYTDGSSNTVPGLPSGSDRVYVRDTLTDALELVSVKSDGTPAASSQVGAISPDGRYVLFVALEPLVPGDTNTKDDVYLRDRKLQKTELVSLANDEKVADGDSGDFGSIPYMDISDDGRYVVFDSEATNLLGAGGDTNNQPDVYWRDRKTGTTVRVSQNGATAGNGSSLYPSMSADGMTVAFATFATNLTANDTNGKYDIAVRRMDGATTPVRASVGLDPNANGFSNQPRISADGMKVVFTSDAPDLVANDTNGATDVFMRNLANNTTTRMSVWTGGTQINGGSEDASISADGSRVTFETKMTPAANTDADALEDVYLREGSNTTRESKGPGVSDTSHAAGLSAVSNDTVVWGSVGQMASVDTNSTYDVFIRRTPFTGPHLQIDDLVETAQLRILGTADPAKVSAMATAIRAGASPEHAIVGLVDQVSAAKKAPVTRLYWAYFKRRPDLGGLNYWISKYSSGMSLQKISLKFAQSNEFKTKYGNTTSSQFVTLVYQNVLERQPESAGLAYWSKKIDQGTSRGQVMTSFSESSEGKRTMSPYVDTVLIGLGLIGKIPSQALFEGAADAVIHDWPREIIVDYVLGAPEYSSL